MAYGIRVRKRQGDKWKRARTLKTPRGVWKTKKNAEFVLERLKKQGWRGHIFEIEDKFRIVSRKEWGAKPPKSSPVHDNWRDGVKQVVHHTADHGPANSSKKAAYEHARSMQYFHQRVRGWNDIGYNYLVFPNGLVLEGRGFGVRGAGAADSSGEWNTDYAHVSFVGTYTDKEPTKAAVDAYNKLRKHLKNAGAKTVARYGHGDLMPTSCPGDGVRRAVGL